MTIAVLIAGAVVVFAIAAVVIGRETGRLAAAPPRPVFDMDEAVVWVGDRLPPEVAGQLSHADVRRILLLSVEHLRVLASQDRTADEDERFVAVFDRAVEEGRDWTPVEVRAVLDAQTEYLEVIGAAAPAPEPPEMPPAPGE